MSLAWYQFERGLSSYAQDGETRYFDGEPHSYGCLRDASCLATIGTGIERGNSLQIFCDCTCHNGEQL